MVTLLLLLGGVFSLRAKKSISTNTTNRLVTTHLTMTRSIKASHYKENLFPHSELTKIAGKPTYPGILNLRREVNANLASVPSTLGGGQFGHMALGLKADTYTRLTSAVAYARPEDVGTFTPGAATGEALANAKQTHADAAADFLEVNVLERTIINQLQAALDRFVLLPKTNKISGLIDCSIPDIFEYLFRAYGNITAISLAEERYNVIKLQYLHAEPMETIFDKVNEYANMAEAYGLPESDRLLIELGLIVIMNAVIFADDVGEWHDKEETEKTWANFQMHFIKAQTSYKKNRPSETSSSLGYTAPKDTLEQANALQAQQDLAAATAYIAELEAAQLQLQANQAAQVPPASTAPPADPMQQLLQKISELQAEVQANKSTDGGNRKKKKKKKNGEKSERKYCWSHGACAHTGSECNHPKEGHKKEATFENRMAGSTKDCFWLPSTSA